MGSHKKSSSHRSGTKRKESSSSKRHSSKDKLSKHEKEWPPFPSCEECPSSTKCSSSSSCEPPPPPKPKVFKGNCPPQTCCVCEGQEAQITVCTNNAQRITWEVSQDNGCTFCPIPCVTGPVLRFIAKSCDNGNLYRPVIEVCLKCRPSNCNHSKWVECSSECSNQTCQVTGGSNFPCTTSSCGKSSCGKSCGKSCPQPCNNQWTQVNKDCRCKGMTPGIFICGSVRLTVKQKPKIIKITEPQTVNGGETVQLKAKIKGKDCKVCVQWFHNGEKIRGANSLSLFIPRVSRRDEGIYTIVVKNECGCDQADTSITVVSSCPEISICGPAETCQTMLTLYEVVQSCHEEDTLTYNWSITGDAVIVGSTSSSSVTVLPTEIRQGGQLINGSFTLTLNVFGQGCEFEELTLNVTTHPIPEVLILSPCEVPASCTFTPTCEYPGICEVCPCQEIVYTAVVNPAAGNYTYLWTVGSNDGSGGAGIVGPNDESSVTVMAGDSGCFQVNVRVELNGCVTKSSRRTQIVNSTVISVTKTANPSTICVGDCVAYLITVKNNSRCFTWTGSVVDPTLDINQVVVIPPGQTFSLAQCQSFETVGQVTNTVTASGTFNDPDSTPDAANAMVIVTVQGPVITVQPTDQTICQGNDANFNVTATGTGLTYQWFLNCLPIPGATSSTLTIEDPQCSGNVFVVVTDANGCSVTSDTVSLTVNPVPTICVQPEDQTVCSGTSVTFTVVVCSDEVTYQWFKNGVVISGATGSFYTETNPVNGDTFYVVINPDSLCPVTSETATVTIQNNLIISATKTANPSTICVGGCVAFLITVHNNSPCFTWAGTITDELLEINQGVVIPPNGNFVLAQCYMTQTPGELENTVTANGSFNDPNSTVDNASASVTVTVNGPVISTQPQDTSVCTGGDAEFSVTAGGADPLTYQWFLNGILVPGATESSFTVEDATTNSTVYVVVTDSNGCSVTSDTATLTVLTPPVITTQPQNLDVCEGDPAVFTVVATGPNLSYQWFFNGDPVGTDSPTLTIDPTTVSGTVTVNVSNESCTVTSASAQLTVLTDGALFVLANIGIATQVNIPDNNTFFSNVLGNRTRILIFNYSNTTEAITGFNSLVSFYNTLGTVTGSSPSPPPLTTVNFNDYDLFISIYNSTNYNAGEVANLQSFLNDCGRVMFIGPPFIDGETDTIINAINTNVTAVGGTMLLSNVDNNSGSGSTNVITPGQFTTGVFTINYTDTNEIALGMGSLALFAPANAPASPMGAYQLI